MKIYVIEDNPVYNDYVCNLLKKEGFTASSLRASRWPSTFRTTSSTSACAPSAISGSAALSMPPADDRFP